MIYVNDKPIKDADVRCKNFYEAKMKELRSKYPKTLIIRESKKIRFYEYVSKDGFARQVPEDDTIFMCPLKKSKAIDGYADTWYWSSSAVRIEDGSVKLTYNSRELKGTLRIDMEQEADFAFFFVYILPFVEKGRYYIVDEDAEAEKKLVTIGASTDLDFFLTSEHSPLHEDKEALLILARSWGIENAGIYGDARLKLKIREAVILSEADKAITKRGIKEFCQETKLGTLVKLRAKVQLAVDEKYIVFDLLNGGWFFSKDWYEGQQILKCTSPDIEALQRSVKDNPQVWQRVKAMFETSDLSSTPPSNSNDLLPDMETIREQLKQANFNVVGKTKEQLIEAWKDIKKD